jgi:hypothetical protein
MSKLLDRPLHRDQRAGVEVSPQSGSTETSPGQTGGVAVAAVQAPKRSRNPPQVNTGLAWQERAANIKLELDRIGVRKGDTIRLEDCWDGTSEGTSESVVPDTGSIDFTDGYGPRGDDIDFIEKVETVAEPAEPAAAAAAAGETESKEAGPAVAASGLRVAANTGVDALASHSQLCTAAARPGFWSRRTR